MTKRDPTGEPIEEISADEAKAAIRDALCLGPENCRYDHEHTVRDDHRPTETIDPKEQL